MPASTIAFKTPLIASTIVSFLSDNGTRDHHSMYHLCLTSHYLLDATLPFLYRSCSLLPFLHHLHYTSESIDPPIELQQPTVFDGLGHFVIPEHQSLSTWVCMLMHHSISATNTLSYTDAFLFSSRASGQ